MKNDREKFICCHFFRFLFVSLFEFLHIFEKSECLARQGGRKTFKYLNFLIFVLLNFSCTKNPKNRIFKCFWARPARPNTPIFQKCFKKARNIMRMTRNNENDEKKKTKKSRKMMNMTKIHEIKEKLKKKIEIDENEKTNSFAVISFVFCLFTFFDFFQFLLNRSVWLDRVGRKTFEYFNFLVFEFLVHEKFKKQKFNYSNIYMFLGLSCLAKQFPLRCQGGLQNIS